MLLLMGALAVGPAASASSDLGPCDLIMGDVNASGAVDLDDVHALTSAIFVGRIEIEERVADVNGDGALSVGDVVYLAAFIEGGAAPVTDITPGDANDDGAIDIADLVTVSHYLTGTQTDICMTGADANADGQLDVADLSVIADFLGRP